MRFGTRIGGGMKKALASLQFKQIRPKGHFSYEVDYEIEFPRGSSRKDIPISPRVTGELTVRVDFPYHGRRDRCFRIEKIKKKAKEEIRELLSILIKQIAPE